MGEGHRARMTARFLKGGFDGFEEHEILEYMLFYALPRVNTNDIAHRLMGKFGSLAGVLEAGEADIARVKGMGSKSAAYLTMFPDLLRAYKKSKIGKNPALRSIKQACEFCVAMLLASRMKSFM
jgi:DNA repair protein RadC